MEKFKINFLLGLFLLFSANSFAQSSVSGTISDSDGNPIPGATIIVDGTTNGTTTDFDGNYTISVNSGQSLQFSSLGFSTQIIRFGDQSTIDVILQTSAEALDEIVVTGYGTQTKRETTGAISTVKAADLNIIPSGNIEQ